MSSVIPVAVAVATWFCLVLRYYLKVPKDKRWTILLIASLTPWGAFTGAVVKGFSIDLSAWLVAVGLVIPWLATGFKPELMIDAGYVHGDDATEEQENEIQKYQWRAILIIVVLVVVGMIVYRESSSG